MKVEKIFRGDYDVLYPQDLPSPVRNEFRYEYHRIRDLQDYAPLEIRIEEGTERRFKPSDELLRILETRGGCAYV